MARIRTGSFVGVRDYYRRIAAISVRSVNGAV